MNGFLTSAFLTLTAAPILAMPITNETTITDGLELENSFVAEPRGRGTIGLLWSCLVTFGLCTWTAVHPNIVPGSTTWGRLKYKLFWALCAVLLPEFILLCAFGQWYKAQEIRKAWDDKFGKDSSLGLAGGFFVLMGGLTVGKKDGRTFTLTPKGFQECLDSNAIKEADLQKRFITDKGKASHLTKLLALVQATWFIFQCIARHASGLPVTLLEIHVAIQVLYTWISYFFWWCKPMDVNEPIKLNIDPDILVMLTTPPMPAMPIEIKKTPTIIQPISIQDPMDVKESDTLSKYNVVIEKPRPGILNLLLKCVYDILEYIVGECYGDIRVVGLFIISNGALHMLAWNIHFATTAEQMIWRISCALISLGAVIYIPIVAKTDFEDYLLEAVWDLRFSDKKIFRRILSRFKEDYKRVNGRWLRAVFVFSWLMASTYAFCILFITVESFISLRSLPMGSYSTPVWVGDKYWPHLG